MEIVNLAQTSIEVVDYNGVRNYKTVLFNTNTDLHFQDTTL